ncbi:MAG: amidohydrolase [Candidatus Aminicenantes bacterium]|jgi:predicted amidohydrolase YtcJ
MKKLTLWISLFFVFGLLLHGFQGSEKADMVLTNGKVFTGLNEKPRFQAVAVKDGKILAVGTNEEITESIGPSTQVLDVKGKLVIPGFIDAHCHFSSGGRSLTKLDLRDARTIETIQDRIAERIKELSEGELVVAYASYPNPSLFKGLGWPTKEILDHVSPNNPVIIQRRGGHAVWVNSVALEKSDITKDTEAPPGGEIVKDPETGEPTGILKEAASNLLKVWDKPKPREDIGRALEHAAQLGITGVQTGSYLKEIEIFKELEKEGKLTLRVYAWVPVQELDRAIEKEIKHGQGDEMVRVGLVKMYIDGTIGVRSALMFESFTEEPGNTGLAQYEEEEFYALVEKAHRNGYQVGVHAIGDKAVHWVLNAFERAQNMYGKKALRHRVEHCTVVTFEDAERFGKLGVVASMQPNITGSEIYRRVRLGKERARRVDMWRTLLNNGAVLAWGTDWPVSPLNPMENLYQLVTRYYTEERMTMAEAIKYYTYGSAYASHEEDIKGTLEKGKLADMVVLSRDLFTIPSREILRTEVLYTILGGKIVYQK